jgi:hypothetical protein
VRTYGFLSSILPYSNADWERLSIFLNFLIPKLPAPKEEDLSKGILEAIDMDSYRAEVNSAMKIALEDEDGVVGPVPVGRRRPAHRARARPPLRDHQDLQRPVRQHRLEGRGQDPPGHRRGDPCREEG